MLVRLRLLSCLKSCGKCSVKCASLLRKQSIKIFILMCVFLALHAHFRVMPRIMGSYNDKCYLGKREYEDMRFLLTRVTEAFNKHNVTYWLDYGTLLGAWKTGEILNYDGDVDIGRLFVNMDSDSLLISKVSQYLKGYNITASPFTAKYRSKTADLFRWEVTKNTTGRSRSLHKWYPFIERYGLLETVVNYFLPPDTPYDILFPTRDVTIYNTPMKIPNKPFELIKHRYPLTWFISFPYKWKCWL